MLLRAATMALGLALALVVSANAAVTDVTGTVKYTDEATNTVHFTDGRVVRLEPGARVLVNGRETGLEAVRPGTVVVVRAAGIPVVAGHPPVDASGVAASVDQLANTVTFEDGRVLRIPRERVWQAVSLETVRPGDQIFINAAQPIAFRTPTTGAERMGTVLRVDNARRVIVLRDGTVVRVMPGTAVTMGNQRLTISSVRPGDEVVITVQEPRAATDSAGSALPRQDAFGTVTIDARDILIVRRSQAP